MVVDADLGTVLVVEVHPGAAVDRVEAAEQSFRFFFPEFICLSSARRATIGHQRASPIEFCESGRAGGKAFQFQTLVFRAVSRLFQRHQPRQHRAAELRILPTNTAVSERKPTLADFRFAN